METNIAHLEPEKEKADEPLPRTPCSRSWDYCPECGSKKHQHVHGYEETHRYCLDCGQEWHTHIDYSEVVNGNLSKAISEIKRLRAISSENETSPDAGATEMKS
jgi:transcription initiation factor TFIIIB Brf1 subunit/transcription initiation factor TFIIB